MREMQKPETYYEDWFLRASLFERGLPTYLTWIAINSAVVLACFFVISRGNSDHRIRRASTFWLVIAAGVFFVMSPVSKPVWQLFPVLQNIQFPFRFNTILVLVTAAMAALGIHSLTKPLPAASLAALVTGILFILPWLPVTALSAWREYRVHPQTRAHYRENLERGNDPGEYRPRWANAGAFYQLREKLSLAGPAAPKVTADDGTAKVRIQSWAPRRIVLQSDSPREAMFNVYQLYYPGWTARLDDGAGTLSVQPSAPEGLVRIQAPPGNHRIELELATMAPERAGQILSAVSVLIALIIIVIKQK